MAPRLIACLMILCAASQASAQERRLPGSQNSARHGPFAVSFLPVDSPEQPAPREQPAAVRSVLFSSTMDESLAPQEQEKPQLPAHTGLPALWHETVSDFASFPRRKSTWAFLAIGAAGALAIHPADVAINQRLTGNETVSKIFAPGKYLGGGVQVAAGVGAYVVGRYMMPAEAGTHRTNKVAHIGFDLVRAQILTQSMTYAIKLSVRRDRPTGECCSFPSGHASATFATAAVLERHFGLRGAWPTLLIASYVAASRLHDNRHYASDVVFGAALGTATGWTVVGRHGGSSYALLPVPVRGGVGLMLVSQR